MPSEIPIASNVVERLEKASNDRRLIPHLVLTQALEHFPHSERVPLELLVRMVNVACDQTSRWYGEFLCSPNGNRNQVAREETELWINTWLQWAEMSWRIQPDLQAIDERMLDNAGILEVTRINIEDWKKRPVRKITRWVSGRLARWFHNAGIRSVSRRLGNIAMFPPGSFGRLNEVVMLTSLAGSVRERGQRGTKSETARSHDEIEALKGLAERGDADAQVRLGNRCKEGVDVPRDYAEALRLYRDAATRGFPGAQYNLGLMYFEGSGVQQDDRAAAGWFQKAAELDYPEAQSNLAWMFLQGRGVPQDDVDSVSWYRRAAERGESRAVVRLGVAYSEGKGVQRDLAEAYKWTLIASNLGDKEPGQENLVKELIAAYRRELSPDQLEEGRKRAEAWVADFQSRDGR